MTHPLDPPSNVPCSAPVPAIPLLQERTSVEPATLLGLLFSDLARSDELVHQVKEFILRQVGVARYPQLVAMVDELVMLMERIFELPSDDEDSDSDGELICHENLDFSTTPVTTMGANAPLHTNFTRSNVVTMSRDEEDVKTPPPSPTTPMRPGLRQRSVIRSSNPLTTRTNSRIQPRTLQLSPSSPPVNTLVFGSKRTK